MKKTFIGLVCALVSLASFSALAADTARTLRCGISGDREAATNEILTHFAIPGYEVGQVLAETASYSLKASYLNGELDLELTDKASQTKISAESYGGIPAGQMPKVMIKPANAPSIIGYCTFK